jgi:hypothetical protein
MALEKSLRYKNPKRSQLTNQMKWKKQMNLEKKISFCIQKRRKLTKGFVWRKITRQFKPLSHHNRCIGLDKLK